MDKGRRRMENNFSNIIWTIWVFSNTNKIDQCTSNLPVNHESGITLQIRPYSDDIPRQYPHLH